jgi:hypothetical protein
VGKQQQLHVWLCVGVCCSRSMPWACCAEGCHVKACASLTAAWGVMSAAACVPAAAGIWCQTLPHIEGFHASSLPRCLLISAASSSYRLCVCLGHMCSRLCRCSLLWSVAPALHQHCTHCSSGCLSELQQAAEGLHCAAAVCCLGHHDSAAADWCGYGLASWRLGWLGRVCCVSYGLL